MAPERRSSSTWLAAPIQAERASDEYLVGLAETWTAAAVTSAHANVPTIVCVPTSCTRRYRSQPNGMSTASRSGESEPRTAAATNRAWATQSGRSSWCPDAVNGADERAAERRVRDRDPSASASGEPAVVVALRVPVPVEVVPELGMLTNLGGEDVGHLLRRDRDRLVARNVARRRKWACRAGP